MLEGLSYEFHHRRCLCENHISKTEISLAGAVLKKDGVCDVCVNKGRRKKQGDGEEENVEVRKGDKGEITERAQKRSKRTDMITSLWGCIVALSRRRRGRAWEKR